MVVQWALMDREGLVDRFGTMGQWYQTDQEGQVDQCIIQWVRDSGLP